MTNIFNVTSVVPTDVAEAVRELTLWVEDFLNRNIDTSSFEEYFEQFRITYVVMSYRPEENARFTPSRADRCGSFNSFRSGNKIRYVGVAVSMDPGEVIDRDLDDIHRAALRALLRRCQEPIQRCPKLAKAQVDCMISRLISVLSEFEEPG